MKILIIMGGFFPGKKFGGPPVSVSNFCKLLNDDDCYIYTYNHELGAKEPYPNIPVDTWLIKESYRIKYVSDSEYCKKGFERVIQELNPDIIYLQGLFQSCILPCLELAKRYGTKVLLAPRGELCSGAFKKKYKKIPYIIYLKTMRLIKNVQFQSTSDEETEAIQKILKVDQNRVHLLPNIPSIPKREYEHTKKESGKGKFVFLSRIHPKKNLISAIKYFNGVHGDAIFDIYGPIEDESYWKECQAEIEKLPKNVSVNYCGLVSHDEVHEVFSKYDAFLFPTFSENYGHVIAEALAVGTPVIISDQTPWKNLESERVGWDISLDNSIGFTNAIQSIVDINMNDYDLMRKKTKGYFVEKARLNELRNEYEVVFNTVSHRSN